MDDRMEAGHEAPGDKIKKLLAFVYSFMYNSVCCDVDSVEAEVAAGSGR